ncbi:MAG: hypothetical protein JWQ76_1519, partial [Ramlibacter sp.]|nr:hypothetical protein [Ramlibacter sp.]
PRKSAAARKAPAAKTRARRAA